MVEKVIMVLSHIPHLGCVVCKYVDHDGDSGEYKFTDIGKKVLSSVIIAAISRRSINMEI